MSATHFRAYAGGDPVVFGDCTDSAATFTTEAQISQVVFFGGDQDDEFVLGVCDIDTTGDVNITFSEG